MSASDLWVWIDANWNPDTHLHLLPAIGIAFILVGLTRACQHSDAMRRNRDRLSKWR